MAFLPANAFVPSTSAPCLTPPQTLLSWRFFPVQSTPPVLLLFCRIRGWGQGYGLRGSGLIPDQLLPSLTDFFFLLKLSLIPVSSLLEPSIFPHKRLPCGKHHRTSYPPDMGERRNHFVDSSPCAYKRKIKIRSSCFLKNADLNAKFQCHRITLFIQIDARGKKLSPSQFRMHSPG